MEDVARDRLEAQAHTWRAELKQWESDWGEAHAGKKPARQDIKQNPDIARKYTLYNKARDVLAGRAPLSALEHSQRPQYDRRRRSERQDSATVDAPRVNERQSPFDPTRTPGQRTTAIVTPSTARQALGVDLALTPSLTRRLFTPSALPSSIGPTPHRDGRVLGLFDLIGNTPSRLDVESGRAFATTAVAATTPCSGGRFCRPDNPDAAGSKPSAATPLASNRSIRNIPDPLGGGGQQPDVDAKKIDTPSTTLSTKLRLLETPACLRRVPLSATIDEDDEENEWKVKPLRLPPLPPGKRGLSNLIRGLRKMNEDVLDEDLDVLREMENEVAGTALGSGGLSAKKRQAAEPTETLGTTPKKRKSTPTAEPAQSGTLTDQYDTVGDEGSEQLIDCSARQRPVLLSALDDEAIYDNFDEAERAPQLGRDGQPLRVFKKKGQKRTTRLVKMRPLRNRKPAAAQLDDVDEDTEDVVSETQTVERQIEGTGEEDPALLSGSDFSAPGAEDQSDEGHRQRGVTRKKGPADSETKAVKTTAQKRKAAKGKQDGGKDADVDMVTKAVRKVKATAHANFKRLKLRNSGSKGGPGHNSKFRRRR